MFILRIIPINNHSTFAPDKCISLDKAMARAEDNNQGTRKLGWRYRSETASYIAHGVHSTYFIYPLEKEED